MEPPRAAYPCKMKKCKTHSTFAKSPFETGTRSELSLVNRNIIVKIKCTETDFDANCQVHANCPEAVWHETFYNHTGFLREKNSLPPVGRDAFLDLMSGDAKIGG